MGSVYRKERRAVRLLHYSRAPVTAMALREQRAEAEHKPTGLWVSVEGPDDWAEWCGDSEFMDISRMMVHEVELSPDANVLRITNAAELDAFSDRFVEYFEPSALWTYSPMVRGVRWAEVAEEWQGIIIAPYLWERRLDGPENARWYYGWDCASGCLWDPQAVAQIGVLGPGSHVPQG